MYEVGWNKKLSHIFSFSRYGVQDASPRYSRKLSELIERRNAEFVSESVAEEVIASKDAELERFFASRYSVVLTPQNNSLSIIERLALGATGFHSAVTGFDISTHEMQERKRLSGRELLVLTLSTQTTSWKVEEMCGRISGDVEWRTSRGEIGKTPCEVVSCNVEVTSGCASEVAEVSSGEVVVLPAPEWFVHGMITSSECTVGSGMVVATHSSSGEGKTKIFMNTISQPYAQQVREDRHHELIVGSLNSKESSGLKPPVFSTHRIFETENTICSPSSGAATICDVPVSNYICSVPSDVLLITPGESLQSLVSRATLRCNASSRLLGFSIHVNGETPTHAVLFTSSGYPLVKADGCVTYFKKHSVAPSSVVVAATESTDVAISTADVTVNITDVSLVEQQPLAESCVWSKHFHYLGGGQHGDTQYFDATLFLDTMFDNSYEKRIGRQFVHGLKLSGVIVMAGQ
jgi:hypothetical protein